MLNDVQKMTIRVAVAKATDKDAEIKKLSVGFKAPEKEIRTYWESVSKRAPVVSESPKTAPVPKPQGSKKGRIYWTDDMLRQLDELHNLGNTAPQIAKVMGLDVKQVINKLHRKPDPRAAAPSLPAPAEPSSETKSDKPIVSEAKTSQVPKPHPADLPEESAEPTRAPAAPQGETPGPVNLSDQISQVKEAIRKTFAPFSVPAQDTEESADGEAETPDYPIDMPNAMCLLFKLVSDNYTDRLEDCRGNNSDGYAFCAFKVKGVCYNLKLEVLE